MSSHEEIFRGVTVIWNKETGSLDIRDENNRQLALLIVTGED